MSFNIFGPSTKDSIKVGYISTERGFVDGISICEANEYAQLNPGTQFVFKTRDKIEYLNINEVNKLTPDDIVSSGSTCSGVQLETECGPARAYFYGGGGVGVQGNPVIGQDGALLAVDLVHGGYGYQYPPIVEVKDNCGLGAGAVTRAVLGEVIETEEFYDQEGDFEEYEICDPTDVGFGRRYDPNGKDIGEWNPNLYANLSEDPIAREIKEYQDFLEKLQNPWWSTRQKAPLKVTTENKESRTKFDVRHPVWGGQLETSTTVTTPIPGEALSPKEKAPDFREVTFNIFASVTRSKESKEFGVSFKAQDGSHSFSIIERDFKQERKDQKFTVSLKTNTVYTVTGLGSYRKRGTELGLIGLRGKKPSEISAKNTNEVITGKVIFADLIGTANDNDDLQIEATLGQFSAKLINDVKESEKAVTVAVDQRSLYQITYQLEDSSAFIASSASKTKSQTVTTAEVIEDTFMNQYAISPVGPSNVRGTDFAGIPYAFEWEEDFPFDGEYIFKGQCDNKAELYIDNVKVDNLNKFNDTPSVIKKDIKAGVHRIRLDLLNIPIKEPKPETIKQTSAPELPAVSLPKQPLWYPVNAGVSIGLWNSVMKNYAVFPKVKNGIGISDNLEHTLTYRLDIKQSGRYTLEYASDNYGTWSFDGKEVGKLSPKNGGDGSTFTVGGKVNLDILQGQHSLTMTVKAISGGVLNGVRVAVDSPAGIAWKLVNSSGKVVYTSRDLATTQITPNTPVAEVPTVNTSQPTWYPVSAGVSIKLWNSVMKNYAVFPKVKDGLGVSDNLEHTLTYTLEITQSGEYTLDYASDNYGTWSFDGKVVGELAPKNGGDGSTFTKGGNVKLNLTPGSYPLTMKVKAISGGTLNGVAVAVNSPAGIAWKLVNPNGQVVYTSRDLHLTVNQVTTPAPPVTPPPAPAPEPPKPTGIKQNIFNTIDYINKSDRQLYRVYPPKGRDSDFFQQYAISPFNPLSPEAGNDSFAGTHVIRWEAIEFPIDGNYNIEVMCDDNVTLYIGNRDGEGRSNIGNGLVSVDAGGDEVIVSKKGFSAAGQATGKSLETKFFKAGKYRIRAELEQAKGEPLAKGNGMALAVNIVTSVVENDIISAKSWKENPMGVALTIEAPAPSIPQEPIPQQQGRCPNNPIWTTRFPNANEKWYPVKYKGNPQGPQIEGWGKFMNRYAISPIPPRSIPGSDGGGVIYRNSWNLDIPYDGFYALRSTVDNAGRILIDGQIVAYADYIRGDGRKNISTPINVFRSMVGFDDTFGGSDLRSGPGYFGYQVDYPRARSQGFTDADIRNYLENDYKGEIGPVMKEKLNDPNWGRITATLSSQTPGQIFNWRTENPKSHKIFLTKGKHSIEVEVENRRTETYEFFDQKIFSTKDWSSKLTVTTAPTDVKVLCHAGGGFGGLQNTAKQDKVGRVIVGKGSNGSPGLAPGVGKVAQITEKSGGGAGTSSGTPSKSFGVNLNGNSVPDERKDIPAGESRGLPRRFYIGRFFGTSGTFISLNGGASALFKSGYGYGGSVHIQDVVTPTLRVLDPVSAAGGSGAVQIKYGGKIQDYTKPGTYEFIVPEGITTIDVICIGGGGSGYSEKPSRSGTITLKSLNDSGGSGGAYASSTGTVTPGTRLKVVVGSGGSAVSGGSANGEDSYVEIATGAAQVTSPTIAEPTLKVAATTTGAICPGDVKDEVIFEGTTCIANYKGDFISPLLENVNAEPNEEIQGKSWTMRWKNVDFPETGQYTLETEADDQLIIRIDGTEVGRAKVFGGRQKTNFNATKGKRTVELELSNIRIENTGFNQNPVVAFAQITKKIRKVTGTSKAWNQNPIGISAMLIPPPCPKLIKGRGVVTEVIVDDPGNRYPSPPGDGYPVALKLTDVIIAQPGINYDCAKDKITITPDLGCNLSYTCDTFGRITKVTVNGGCYGFTERPEITIETETGIGVELIPSLSVIRTPIGLPPEKLIQVTDLVGLKQTGYVDGKPYYGAVFYQDGIRYAGYYLTPGDLVQVYDTLQESITSQITTPPSAIQRQGTDVSSNDPRLNLPGTPENLI